MKYIGCDIPYLKEWFQFNFTTKMNWDNYGVYWSIDHVIPVKHFDLTNEDEANEGWNWRNLVPVSIKYNSQKKSTIDPIQKSNIEQKLIAFKKIKEEGSTTK